MWGEQIQAEFGPVYAHAVLTNFKELVFRKVKLEVYVLGKPVLGINPKLPFVRFRGMVKDQASGQFDVMTLCRVIK